MNTKHHRMRNAARLSLGIALAMSMAFAGNGEDVRSQNHRRNDFCSQTARALYDACKSEASDDSFRKKALCINLADEEERDACMEEMEEERQEALMLCRGQRDGRLAACGSLGEGRYDPDLDPARFDDPKNPANPNPYFPLTVGNLWEYRGGDEINTVEVVNETKLIAGVRCIVFRDLVSKNGDLVEATDDWFAPAKDGNIWYLGEEVKDFESFDGDNPRRPELISTDGSFKAGRDGDKPGIIFRASPRPGEMYLEEFSLGNAEDMTEVLSITYALGRDPELDRFVPRLLADRFCPSGDCVVTRNFSLLEPGISARKYYARGIGFFLEVNPDTGETLQLVDCNFDPRCASLANLKVRRSGSRLNPSAR